jgi:CMP-N,N'-diacetyllegionaminic acid synthase
MNKKRTQIIGLIPARKNSQDLKNKNLKKLNNLSLFELAILGAKKSKLINKIYLSSDSKEILKRGKKYNINLIKRKKSLSTNSATANSLIFDFIKHYLKNDIKNNIIVYLQPTSPFRNNIHIDQAISSLIKKKLRSVLSVNENKNFFKSFKKNKDTVSPFFNDKYVTNNRQNLKKIYSPNGAIYIFYASDFIKNKKLSFIKSGYYPMNRIDSIDIDDKEDYELAKFLSKKYLKIKK